MALKSLIHATAMLIDTSYHNIMTYVGTMPRHTDCLFGSNVFVSRLDVTLLLTTTYRADTTATNESPPLVSPAKITLYLAKLLSRAYVGRGRLARGSHRLPQRSLLYCEYILYDCELELLL